MKQPNIMKYVVYLLLIVIIILGINSALTYHKLKSSLDETTDYKFKYSLVKDSLGRTHANFQIEDHHLNQLTPDDRTLVNTTAKEHNVKPDDIKSVTQVSSSTTAPIYIHDTIFTDGHLSVNTHHTDTGLVGTYTYEDTCWLAIYSKPKKFLGIKYKTNTFGDVHFGNPNTTITGLDHISIDKLTKPQHFSVGPMIGITYVDKVRPFIGFGATFSLFKF